MTIASFFTLLMLVEFFMEILLKFRVIAYTEMWIQIIINKYLPAINPFCQTRSHDISTQDKSVLDTKLENNVAKAIGLMWVFYFTLTTSTNEASNTLAD